MKWLAEGARGLSPAYIALVMATGIVSIASDRAAPCDCRCPPVAERGAVSAALDFTAWRLLRYRRALLDDLRLLTPTIVEMNSLRTADTGPA